VPIEFLDLLGGGGWEPLPVDVGPAAVWSEGGSLAEAPVDVEATFRGALWRATDVDPTFGLTGVRVRDGFRIPVHHHDRSLLLIVFGGTLAVDTAAGCGPDADVGSFESVDLGDGQYCVLEAGTAFSLTAGPEGVTFLASWPQGAPEPGTCWHPDPAWVPAEGRATA